MYIKRGRTESILALIAATDRARIHQPGCGTRPHLGCRPTKRLPVLMPTKQLATRVCGRKLMLASPAIGNRQTKTDIAHGRGASSPLLPPRHRHRHTCTPHELGAPSYTCLALNRSDLSEIAFVSKHRFRKFGGRFNATAMLGPIFDETIVNTDCCHEQHQRGLGWVRRITNAREENVLQATTR